MLNSLSQFITDHPIFTLGIFITIWGLGVGIKELIEIFIKSRK